MSDTSHLALPLLAAAQAQKHVTMNEALTRLDALAAPSALSSDLGAPPATPAEGDVYVVAAPATGPWAGQADQVAFFVNGGWDFASPRPGWRVWIADRGGALTWSGLAWVADLLGQTSLGAATHAHLTTVEEEAPAGGAFDSATIIPDRAVVIGVTARVSETLTGAGLTGWRVGVAGAPDRYGTGIGLVKDSTVNGVTGAPVAYYGDTPLQISPEGGDFAGGALRLAIHYLMLTPPAAA